MRRTKRVLLALLLVLSIVFSGLSGGSYVKAEKAQTKRTIAIVYDNSGSMYYDYDNGSNNGKIVYDKGKMTWCQATYAVEVFASMMNEGDTIQIYPMNQTKVAGKNYDMYSPLIISDPKQAKDMETVFIEMNGGTPIESIDAAYQGLSRAGDSEKWLIVLTDGSVFHENGNELSVADTKEHLADRLGRYANSVNVLYLGIGDVEAPSFTGNYLANAVVAKNGSEVPQVLTQMCNQIFGRDELRLSGKQVSFDVSLKQMFVFVQGKDISNVNVLDANGQKAGNASAQYTLKYAEGGCYPGNLNYPSSTRWGGVDTSLQGVIAKFTDLPAGSYTLDYSGNASSTAVYYEPDVDLVMQLLDANGNPVTEGEIPGPGEYRMKFGLIDNQTGQPTNSELLGTQRYNVKFSVNDEQQVMTAESAGEIRVPLEAGDNFKLDELTAQYLSGYQITKTGEDFGWPFTGLNVTNLPGGDLTVQISSGETTYKLSQMTKQTPFEIQLYYDGELMTEAELREAEVSFDVAGGNAQLSVTQSGDKILVTPAYADPSAPETTEEGSYTITVNASYTKPDHATSRGNGEIHFDLTNDVTGITAQLQSLNGTYTMSQFKGTEFSVDLRMGGEDLTEEQWQNLSYEVHMADKKGNEIPLTVEKDETLSRLVIKPKENGVALGKYKVNVIARTLNQLGQTVEGTAEKKVSITLLPPWVVLLIVIGAILAVLGILWFIFSRKVLPRSVELSDVKFSVGGTRINGPGSVTYSGSSAEKVITVTAPHSGAYAQARCSVSIKVRPNDTLWKVMWSKIRHRDNLSALCVDVPHNTGVKTVNLSGVSYKWNTRGQLMPNPALQVDPDTGAVKPYAIGTGALVSTAAERGGYNMKFSFIINFK